MRVAVLGGGLQGACVALELAGAGVSVDVYDKNARCLTQASAQNEGKIHLGYVYANDPSLSTARMMIRGAATFAPLLRRWIGAAVDAVPVSAPFYYAVHADSLLGVGEVERHFHCCHAIALDEGGGARPDYFGEDPRVAPTRLSDAERDALFSSETVTAAFRTSEIGIDPVALTDAVRERLTADPRVTCIAGAFVRGVEPEAGGVTVRFEREGIAARERYDHVVNTLWEGRLAVDRTAGVEPERPWLYRVKHHLRVQGPGVAARIPSTTVVLGAFGDTAGYGTDALYLSWYPAGMLGTSAEISPPAWPLPLGELDAAHVRQGILDGLARIVPAVGDLPAEAVAASQVKGGIIFAWGQTDIDDRASGLHERHAIGPRSHGRYHTVDTGKLTMAPLFGKRIADRIRQIA